MKKRIPYVLFLIVCFPQCAQKKVIKKKVIARCTQEQRLQYPPVITVWIHGTRFFRHPVYHSVFEGTACLKPARLIDPYYQVRQIAHTLAQSSCSFDFNTFYIFGWSGKLSTQERKEAATILYDQLCALTEQYENQYGYKPAIKLIAHSHGGNLALHLAENIRADRSLVIEQLVLLACPVQASTMNLTRSTMFKQIYAFYSSLDMVQRLAPQMYTYQTESGKIQSSLKIPPLSEQRFPHQPNLAQAKVKINGRALFHSEFTGIPFLKALSQLLSIVEPPSQYFDQPDIEQLIAIQTVSSPTHHRLRKSA